MAIAEERNVKLINKLRARFSFLHNKQFGSRKYCRCGTQSVGRFHALSLPQILQFLYCWRNLVQNIGRKLNSVLLPVSQVLFFSNQNNWVERSAGFNKGLFLTCVMRISLWRYNPIRNFHISGYNLVIYYSCGISKYKWKCLLTKNCFFLTDTFYMN